ncbi:MAG: amino acid aminotransferase [Waddliaceae bacterium]
MTHSFFQNLEEHPADPILGLTVAFNNDQRADKVNLGVGTYCTSEGAPFVLECVRTAEKIIWEQNLDKEYLPIIGKQEFIQSVASIVLGEGFGDRLFGAQTIGGSGALRMGGELLKENGCKKIYLPTPTWPNHTGIFDRIGLEIDHYTYYNPTDHSLNFSRMCEEIEKMPRGSLILFHTCCHNPTGQDPTDTEWETLSQIVKARGLFPIFDNAYQGFGDNFHKDSFPIRLFAKQGHELMVAVSFSKNLGLYGERVGALLFLLNESQSIAAPLSQLKTLIRRNYSSPPIHASRIVTTILQSESLKKQWLIELNQMRERIIKMRSEFATGLTDRGFKQDVTFFKKQNGMFSLTGLSHDQVEKLKKTYGVYMPKSGRINFAGLNTQNMELAIDALLHVQ